MNDTLHEAGPARSSSPASGSGGEAAASAPHPEDLARQRLSRLLANPPPFFVQRKRVQGHARAIVEAVIKLERQIASGGGEPASLTMSAQIFGEAIEALAECERALTALTEPDQEEESACRP